jgi:hypothetical protein
MDWIKKNTEKFLLMLGMGFLIIGSLVGGLLFSKEFDAVAIPKSKADAPPKIEGDVASYENLLGKLTVVARWEQPKETLHRLFISRRIEYLPLDKKITVYDPTAEGVDGISREWKEMYKFSLSDPNVKDMDPDNDGFNNKEEYDAKTVPTDPNSLPPLVQKLKVVEFKSDPFPIKFAAINDAEFTVQFDEKAVDKSKKEKRSNTVKVGDVLVGAGSWKVLEFRPIKNTREVMGGPQEFDDSELILENEKTGRKLTLVYVDPLLPKDEKEKRSQDPKRTVATIEDQHSAAGGRKYTVMPGDTFKFRDGNEYRVISLDDSGAKLESLQTKKSVLIPR